MPFQQGWKYENIQANPKCEESNEIGKKNESYFAAVELQHSSGKMEELYMVQFLDDALTGYIKPV